MASAKKRKIETGPSTQPMSAFALRRKFLQEKAASVATGELVEAADAQASAPLPASPRKTRSKASTSPGAAVQTSQFQAEVSSKSQPQGSEERKDLERLVRSKVVQHTSFSPNKKNLQRKSDGTTVVRLPDGERLVILGSYGIKVCNGQATIAGATLRPSDDIVWVHSPHCHALPVLRCSDDTVLELRPHPAASSLRDLAKLSPTLARLWNDNQPAKRQNRQGRDTFQIIYTSADGPRRALLQELKAPGEWNKKLASLVSSKGAKPQVILVCGPKSSGKSTFARLLSNRLTTDETRLRGRARAEVAVLDIDPGQPEYLPPGVVSLVHMHDPNLAPSFCHPGGSDDTHTVVKSHAICAVSPAMDPEHYVACVLDLFHEYKAQLSHKCPIIINTPGWVQGTGLDILMDLIQGVQATEVIYMSQDGPEDTVEGLRLACKGVRSATLSMLPSQASEYTSRTALHFRTMQMMSYFHLDSETPSKEHLAWEARPITTAAPLVVPFSRPSGGIYGIMCYDYQPPAELLAEFINGTVVAMVEIRNRVALRDFQVTKTQSAGAPHNILPLIRNNGGGTLDPEHSRAIGLALIRGIDTDSGCLHLLTPVPLKQIQDIQQAGHPIVLVAGKFDPPSWAYTEDLYYQAYESGAKEDADGEGIDVTDEDTDDDSSENNDEEEKRSPQDLQVPWVEMLHGNQKRAVGSRVWRVRRDLGKGANE